MPKRTATACVVAFLATLFSAPIGAAAEPGPTFVDPTARLEKPQHIRLGHLDYIATFAYLKASSSQKYIHIGDETNVQDSVFVDASSGPVEIGDMVILAHGSRVLGKETPTRIGEDGSCPVPETPEGALAPHSCPSFVGFNSGLTARSSRRTPWSSPSLGWPRA